MKLLPMILNSITTADDQAIDPIRAGMVISGLSLIVLQACALHAGQAFDPISFGSGLSVIFAGGGFGLAAKAKDEVASDAKPDQ